MRFVAPLAPLASLFLAVEQVEQVEQLFIPIPYWRPLGAKLCGGASVNLPIRNSLNVQPIPFGPVSCLVVTTGF